jgi:hypothetical protein
METKNIVSGLVNMKLGIAKKVTDTDKVKISLLPCYVSKNNNPDCRLSLWQIELKIMKQSGNIRLTVSRPASLKPYERPKGSNLWSLWPGLSWSVEFANTFSIDKIKKHLSTPKTIFNKADDKLKPSAAVVLTLHDSLVIHFETDKVTTDYIISFSALAQAVEKAKAYNGKDFASYLGESLQTIGQSVSSVQSSSVEVI